MRCATLGTQVNFSTDSIPSRTHTPSPNTLHTQYTWQERSTQIRRRISSRCRETFALVFHLSQSRTFSPLAARPPARLRRRLRNSASYCICLRSRLLITVRFGVYQVRGKSRRARTGTPMLHSNHILFRTVPTLLDVLEPAREDTSAPFEAHKVRQS